MHRAVRMCILALLAATINLAAPDRADAQSSDADLQKAAQNPVADLISLPFQNNTLFGVGPNDKVVNVLNVQPVIPFDLVDDWKLITRTIAPLIYIPDRVDGLDVLPEGIQNDTRFGLGDINVTGFVSPARPKGFIWGVGPSVTLPTATDDALGSEQFSIGPSVVILAQPAPWTFGALARQLWSIAGEDSRADVNQFLIQPFVNLNLDDGWYLVSSPVLTSNWNADSGERWTVPIGGGAGRLTRIGKVPVNFSAQAFYNLEKPTFGPEFSARLQVQFLFPK